MFKALLLSIAVLFLLSCISEEKKSSVDLFTTQIQENKCEEAEARIPLETDQNQFISLSKKSFGYVVYGATVPVTVGLDVLLAIPCVNLSGFCKKGDPIFVSPVVYEKTKDLRCPDTRYYVNKVMELSSCYEKRGDRGSLLKSLDLVNAIVERYDDGPTCVSDRDAESAKKLQLRVHGKMRELKVTCGNLR
ncbi:hypothetical protein [Bdellovibrio sp. NC01]|uniref:hypothetical protein n=1 Tax=Bdellovibrio sp. NC01 TaxID=2220073 RepID=UPI00115B656C|nr:hypothetical protein [Bdellovibrio sp. NC01]QDK37953.1 hypothetical protein DOE51_10320 [Bdellovibrio sp. NC01]